MCGRYALYADPDEVARHFGLASAPRFPPRYNVCPGTEVLAIAGSPPRAVVRAWGIGGKFANARGETLADKPMFSAAFRGFRCLVPASGFYEWKSVAGRKVPYYVRPADAPLFALAGLVLLWKGTRGVSLVTTAPNELMSAIHERMPLIVPPEHYAAWLDGRNPNAGELVRPYPSERMVAYPVDPRINRPENDDAALIQPVAAPA